MSTRSTVSFRVVGLGRAGRSLIEALSGTNWEYLGGYGRQDNPTEAADGVDAVLVTVPDDAIADVARAIRPASAVLIHLSGAKSLDVLAPHAGRASVHPLTSLPDPTTGAARLRDQATFAVAGHGLAADLVAALNGRAIAVADDQRPLYHAAAAVAANHLVVLCDQVERIAGQLGVPVDLYWDLMESTLRKVRRVGSVAALTGPAARGDDATVTAHLAALGDLGPGHTDLYEPLARRASELGRVRGGNGPHGAGPAKPSNDLR